MHSSPVTLTVRADQETHCVSPPAAQRLHKTVSPSATEACACLAGATAPATGRQAQAGTLWRPGVNMEPPRVAPAMAGAMGGQFMQVDLCSPDSSPIYHPNDGNRPDRDVISKFFRDTS